MGKLTRDDLVTTLDEINQLHGSVLPKPAPVVSDYVPEAFRPLPPPKPKVSKCRPAAATDHPVLAAWIRQEAGRGKRLADLLGVNASIVTLWSRGSRQIPVKRCYQIEDLTEGVLTCEMLRPDIKWKRWKYNERVEHTPTGYVPPPHPRELKKIMKRLI